MADFEGSEATQRPLTGVRVIDLSSFLAAPMTSMFLGDFGADVIKVERPQTGDEARQWGNKKNGVGLYYKVINRNKRSITADLHTTLGVEAVKRLVKSADILCENFRTGTLERWGLGWDVLSEINPGLVMLRISGFGATGPNAGRAGFGTLAEAYSGFAYINGEPERPPLLPPFGLADSTAGLMGAFLCLAALRARDGANGCGQFIDLALYEPLLTLLGPQAIDFDQLGAVQARHGSRHSFTAPRNTFRSREGDYVAIAGASQATFERLCVALDAPRLMHDPRFIDNAARIEHVAALDDELGKVIGQFGLDELMKRLSKAGAAASPIFSISDIFDDEHILARQNLVTVPDAELGTVRFQNVVGKMSHTPGGVRWAGPALGAHNTDVLGEELGFSHDEIARLAAGKD